MQRVFIASLVLLSFAAIALCDLPNGCCTPSQWSATATEFNSNGVITHSIFYDADSKWVRWDRTGNLESSKQQVLQTWLDYNTLYEYIYFVSENKCELYGGDKINLWCYGPDAVGQDFGGFVPFQGNNATRWFNTANDFVWLTDAETCLPIMTKHADDVTVYNAQPGIADKSVFDVPKICKQQAMELYAVHGDNLHSFLKANGCHARRH
jgi:hypothetical protein